MYSQNRKPNFGPFYYPSDRNVPFDGRNKTVRPIFIPVKIEGVINFGPTSISPLGAYKPYKASADIIHVIYVATTLTTLVKKCIRNDHHMCFWAVSSRINI